MTWRQYDSALDDLRNATFKATLAPFLRVLNASTTLHRRGVFPRRVVICGCPRSGTTLLNEAMRGFEDVYVMHREEYALRFPYLVLRPRYVVTKHPLDFRHFRKIIRAFGDPVFLFMLRDPRDVIVSRHFKNADRYLTTFPTWEEAIVAADGIDYDGLMRIRYEDLISRPDEVQTRIADVLDIEVKHRFSGFHEHVRTGHQDIRSLGGVRPIDAKNSGKFTLPEHRGRVREQLRDHPRLSDYLIRFGYEPNRRWEDDFASGG